MTSSLDRVLSGLQGVRRRDTGWVALCPGHDDHTPSLSIDVADDGTILFKCFAGCEQGHLIERVSATVGIDLRELFPPKDTVLHSNGHRPSASGTGTTPRPPAPWPGLTVAQYAAAKQLNPTWLGTCGLADVRYVGKSAVRISYLDTAGKEATVRFRVAMEKGTGWDRFLWQKGAIVSLYGLDRLALARERGYAVLPEGESDTHTLWHYDEPAMGIPGADTWKKSRDAPLLADIPIIYVPIEPDQGGQALRQRLAGSAIADRVRVIDLSPFAVKDVSALHCADPNRFAERWQAAKEAAVPLLEWPSADVADSQEDERRDVSDAGGAPERSSQATKLVALARQSDTDLFHDGTRKSYITFTSGTHRETWPLSGTALRDWLSARFYAVYGTAPGSQALQDAVHTLAGIARFEGECRPVSVRLAGDEETIYLDLGNEEWEIVRITAQGWDIIPAAAVPVRFRRPGGLLPLPRPTRGGTLSALRRLVNVKNDEAFVLVVAWLLGVLRPSGPYTMLYLAGEQGTAKTTLARTLRSLIDPNISPLRTEPREEGDLLIAATNGAVVALDNLSHLPGWLSDGLCRLATGGGLSKRTLYTDADETLIDAQRPILLTGIETVLTRGDAVDRSLLVELEKIPDHNRRTEAELNAEFEASRPVLLGALLDAASTALRNWSTTKPSRLPRMADFARWVEAGAPALGWEPEYFLSIYTGNRAEADEIALDALPVGTAVRAFLADREAWEGTPTELLTVLNERAGETARDRTWPKKAHNLSGQLKRLAPNLRRLGIEVELGVRGTDGRRLVGLTKHATKDSATQRQERQERQESQTHADSRQTLQRQAASTSVGAASRAQHENPHNHAESGRTASALDAVDAFDAVSAPLWHEDSAERTGGMTAIDPWAHATRHRL
jgi:hypothetical protein